MTNARQFIKDYKKDISYFSLILPTKKSKNQFYLIPFFFFGIFLIGLKYFYATNDWIVFLWFALMGILYFITLVTFTKRIVHKNYPKIKTKWYEYRFPKLEEISNMKFKKYISDNNLINKIDYLISDLKEIKENENYSNNKTYAIFGSINLVILSSYVSTFLSNTNNNSLSYLNQKSLGIFLFLNLIVFFIIALREGFEKITTNYSTIQNLIEKLEDYRINN